MFKFSSLTQFFQKEYQTTCLTKDSLKEFMYEAGIYSRVNFNWLKTYIFAQEEEIAWETIFKIQCSQPITSVSDTIPELSEEYLASEKQLIP
jgi:hypothetical protein